VWPISGKEETHTTTREHNSTLTEAEERRAASYARLYTPAARPPPQWTSDEVVPLASVGAISRDIESSKLPDSRQFCAIFEKHCVDRSDLGLFSSPFIREIHPIAFNRRNGKLFRMRNQRSRVENSAARVRHVRHALEVSRFRSSAFFNRPLFPRCTFLHFSFSFSPRHSNVIIKFVSCS